MTTSDIVQRMAAVVGPKGVLTGPTDMAPYLVEQRGLYQGQAAAVLRPASTQDVSALLKIAHETGTAIVPQGGNTGLVGGQIPFDPSAIIVCFSRMNRVRGLDVLNNTLTVEAGLTLAQAQQAAADADRLFPLSLGSEGSCQIGGNLATNAGGTAVLRYGTARDLVLGLEVVLADGRIWDGLTGLRKDNTGYDLKQLFIGSEGTLGLITGAVLKLFPPSRTKATAFAAVPDAAAAVALLHLAEEITGGRVSAFELMARIGLDFAIWHGENLRDPLAAPAPWYVLMDLSASTADDALESALESVLVKGTEAGLVIDATLAQTEAQAQALWRLRETLPEAQRFEGGSIKHDISVPVSAISAFITRASIAVEKALPGVRPVPFGHVGDGNVHFNLSQPPGMESAAFLALWREMNEIVHGIARDLGGSISAEHGIGVLKRDELASLKAGVDIDLMRALKRTLDPKNILNPGKVISLD